MCRDYANGDEQTLIFEATTPEYSIDTKSKATVNKICISVGKVGNRDDVLLTVTNYFSGEEEMILADANAIIKKFCRRSGADRQAE